MRSENWEKVSEVFEQALDLPAAEREEFLVGTCGDDAGLLARVQAMLRADARASPLLDSSPDDLAAAVTDEAPRFEGRRIGPYTIRWVLGRGGMGIVCLAEREDVGKQVALKLVAGGLASPERITRFFLERRVLAQLEHPHIATLIDAGVAEDGTPWLAMEYVPGEAIDVYCRARALPVEARLGLFEKICCAVGYAHRHLVVHRDLKPSNILIGEDGEPRLLDFGIAKLLSDSTEDAAITGTGQGLMTPHYAAPEQIRGEPITTATDVYQLGVLLFELLTGRRPSRDRDDRGGRADLEPLLKPSSVALRDGGPVPPRRLQGDLDTIVLEATALEPARRYPSAEQLGDDVRRYLAGLPIVARPATAAYRIKKFVARHKAGTAVVATAFLALLGFALAMAAQVRRTEAERVRAEQVSNLLTDVFAGADPTVAQGDTITVRSVLDRGAERIRANLTLDPVVKARLLSVIAEAYDNLGRPDRTVELHTEVVALLRGAVPEDHPARLRALRLLSQSQAATDARERSYRSIDEALAVARELKRSRRAELASILNDAGYARQRSGDDGAARPFYEEALAVYRTLPDSSSVGIEQTLVNLGYIAQNRGSLLQNGGDRKDAEPYFREVLDRRRGRLGANHSLTAKSMLDLATLLARSNQVDEAERLVREATAVQRRVFSAPHADQALGFSSMAWVLAVQGKHAEAATAQREALAVTRQVFGDSSSGAATAVANLAGYVQKAGRLDEAAELHRDAVRRFTARVGERHVSTAVSMTNLAWTERLRNRFAESEALYRKSLPVLDSAWSGTPRVSTNLVDFGIVLSLQNRHREAEPVFRRAVDLGRATLPATNGDLLRSKVFLGNCLTKLGRFAAAESLLVDAHQSLLKSVGPTNQYTIGTASDLADLYQRWGRPGDAARYRAVPGKPD